jgi:hypothetical protein
MLWEDKDPEANGAGRNGSIFPKEVGKGVGDGN